MKNLPPISVVVPTFRRPLSLGRCLAGLAVQDYPEQLFEIVVVDDGGGMPLDSAIAQWATNGNLRLVVQSHAGPATARNRGVEACSHDLKLSTFVRQHFQYGRGAHHYRLARLREGMAGWGARTFRFYLDYEALSGKRGLEHGIPGRCTDAPGATT